MENTNIVLEPARDKNVSAVLNLSKPSAKPGAASTHLRVSKTGAGARPKMNLPRPLRPIGFAARGGANAAAPPAPPRAPPRPQSQPLLRRSDLRAAFVDMAVPDKIADAGGDEDDDDFSQGSFDEGGSFGEGGSAGGGSSLGSLADGDDISPEDGGGGEADPANDPSRPSPGYVSIEDEKCDILSKLARFKKQGRYASKSFTVFSDIRELRAELQRIRTEMDLEASIRFQRKLLMAAVSALEYGNRKFNVADLHLDGWSEQVHSELDTYDGVFTDLFYKYRSKVSAPPEIRLLLMVGSSGLMFHLSHSMFKAAMPQIQQVINQNPQLVQQMAQAYANTATANATSGAAPPDRENSGPPRPMRGPGIDVTSILGGGILGGLPGMPGPSAGLNPLPQMSRGTDKAVVNEAFARQVEDAERLSDVVSEDLESLPSSLSSPASSGSRKRKGGASAGEGIKISRGEGGKKVVVLK